MPCRAQCVAARLVYKRLRAPGAFWATRPCRLPSDFLGGSRIRVPRRSKGWLSKNARPNRMSNMRGSLSPQLLPRPTPDLSARIASMRLSLRVQRVIIPRRRGRDRLGSTPTRPKTNREGSIRRLPRTRTPRQAQPAKSSAPTLFCDVVPTGTIEAPHQRAMPQAFSRAYSSIG